MLKKRVDDDLSQSNNNINIDLQLSLLNTWTKFNVQQYYQNIFLVHLDQLSPQQAEQLIKKQISLTHQKKSLYFQLQKLNKQRQTVIQNLRSLLNSAQENQSSKKISQICEQIKQLREINLILAEHILKMHSLYHCNNAQSNEKQLEYYDSMLNDLDKSNKFLKDSILNKHLNFDQGYDPFLMAQYQNIHRSKQQDVNPAIKSLFSINISYAYRLMKTKNMMLQLKAYASHFQPPNVSETAFLNRLRQSQLQPSHKRFYQKADRFSLKTQSQSDSKKYPQRHSTPIKISPIKVYPYTNLKSRTTIHRQKEKDVRPESTSITEGNQKLRLKFTKMAPQSPSYTDGFSTDIQPSYEKDFFLNLNNRHSQPSKSLDLHRRSLQPLQMPIYKQRKDYLPIQRQFRQNQSGKPYKYKAGVGEIYRPIKLAPLTLRENIIKQDYRKKQNYLPNQVQRAQSRKDQQLLNMYQQREQQNFRDQRFQLPQQDLKSQTINYLPVSKSIKHYNPVKKQQYESYEAEPKKPKYDYKPSRHYGIIIKRQGTEQAQSQQQTGLLIEEPISKYNINKKNKFQKKANCENHLPLKKPLSKANHRVDQQCQTIQMRNAPVKQPKIPEDETIYQVQILEKKKPQKPLNSDSDQTLEDQDIVDERPIKQIKNQPLIRSLNKEKNPKPTRKQESKVNGRGIQEAKQPNNSLKQVRMKVGKANINQVIQLIKGTKIKQEYLKSFDLQKTLAWIQVSQTYLTQFAIGDKTAVIALCSPIPGIGIALKLWAPVGEQIDAKTSSNLFKKYIEFVQKSTTTSKVLFSGESFKQLSDCQFVMKKQNLYERSRKTPARQNNQQFQPFLYIQCSNLKISSNEKTKMLYSEEIQQFTIANSYATSFIANANDNNVLNILRPFIKFSPKLQNFKKANKILTDQDFDNYQANQIQATNIDLMRFYLNTPLKSTFIAQENSFKFNGTLLHQKDKEFVVSLSLHKVNGNMYFAQNVKFPQLLQIAKKTSTSKVNFTVMMFSKKLYGKMPEADKGCYGNWQINLTWQDQLQGRIRHNMNERIGFGPQNFKVLIQFERVPVLGFQVNRQDLI